MPLNIFTKSNWAIYEPALRTMVEIYKRDGFIDQDNIDKWKVKTEGHNHSALDLKVSEGYRYTTLSENVGILNIGGPIFKGANLMTEMSGASSMDLIKNDISKLLDNPDIKGILMNIDSPGGSALGTPELSDFIKEASVVKPIHAFVDGLGASAAYWIASSASHISASKSSLLGSIGVVTSIPVQESTDADGIKNFEIVSTNAENKRPDPLTEKGMSVIKKELDSLEALFISAVAENRGVSEDKVKSDFGQGGVFIAQEAKTVGMIDEVTTFENSLNTFKEFLSRDHESDISQNLNKEESLMANEKKEEVVAKTFTQEEVDALVVDASAKGMADGIKAENERIVSLEKMALAGHEALIASAKADPEMTAEKLAVKIVEAEKEAKNTYAANLKASEEENPETPASVETNPQEEKEEEADPENVTDEDKDVAAWNKDKKLRAEFNDDKESYLAFARAERKGLVKIHKS